MINAEHVLNVSISLLLDFCHCCFVSFNFIVKLGNQATVLYYLGLYMLWWQPQSNYSLSNKYLSQYLGINLFLSLPASSLGRIVAAHVVGGFVVECSPWLQSHFTLYGW